MRIHLTSAQWARKGPRNASQRIRERKSKRVNVAAVQRVPLVPRQVVKPLKKPTT